MYKCLNCGHIFEEGEQAVYRERHGFSGGPYEEFHSCPICGGDIEKTEQCADCGGEFLAEELICGRCVDCLKNAVTYESFLEFATTGTDDPTEVDVLEDFVLRMMCNVNGHDTVITCSSALFKGMCKDYFLAGVDDDKENIAWFGPGRATLLPYIISYIDDSCLWNEFAEYLEKKDEEEKK